MSEPPTYPLPHMIKLKLDEVRQLLRAYLSKKCFYLLICWLLLVFWIGAALDYLPVRLGSDETPKPVRIALLGVMAAGSLWLIVGWLMPRLLRPISDASLALLIERQRPDLNNRLITAVQVCENKLVVDDPDAHQQMFSRVLQQANAEIQSVNATQLFRWQPLNYLRAVALLGLLLTAVTGVMAWPFFKHWNARLFGLSNRPWPRMAVLRADWLQLPLPAFTGQLSAEQELIEFKNGLARVPAGSSPRLQVSADASAPKVPEVCTMYYQASDGMRGRANLRRIGAPRDGWQQFNLDGPPLDAVSSSLTLDIVGLDARLRALKLEVIDPVIITNMQLECRYPKYLLDSLSTRPEKEILPYRAGLKIPEGTECSLLGTCNWPLSQVEYTQDQQGLDAPAGELVVKSAEVNQSQFRISLGQLSSSQLVEIRLRDQYRLPCEQVLRYNLVVQIDSLPEVQSRLEGIGSAITPKAILPIRGKATDDHGIATTVAELSLNETTLPPIPLQLSDTQLSGDIDLLKLAAQSQTAITPGTTLGVSVRATDYYDLAQQQHDGRGQPQQLMVVTEDQLLVALDRQELELRQRLEQIISELSQLKDVLENLAEQLAELEETAQKDVLESNDRLNTRIVDSRLVTHAVVSTSLTQSGNGQQAEDKLLAERQASTRLAVLRAQQCQLQCDKSRQELAGVVNRIENLRFQLINNRIDSVDRQQRLLEKVESPLRQLLVEPYAQLDRQMGSLQSSLSSSTGRAPTVQAISSLEAILQQLEAIKASMLDIESYNEMVDLVRDLLEEQERILKETEEAQKARLLDIFKQP
jgi:hypothetical protein